MCNFKSGKHFLDKHPKILPTSLWRIGINLGENWGFIPFQTRIAYHQAMLGSARNSVLELTSTTAKLCANKNSECFKDAEDEAMTIIPQAYWDDLFDRALATLQTFPMEL
jgi:hypothetical protein